MLAMSCARLTSFRAPVPRAPAARSRDTRAVPARPVSRGDRSAVGGGGSCATPTRGEACSTSASTSDVVRSAPAHGDGWRSHAFASFCDAALALPRVATGLRALEQRHPSMDPSLVLFCFWLATRSGAPDSGSGPGGRAMTHAELRSATRISERWRHRIAESLKTVRDSLLGEDLRGSPVAASVAEIVERARLEAVAAARAELFDQANAWDRYSDARREEDTGDTHGGDATDATDANDREDVHREWDDVSSRRVRGNTAKACVNFRLYTEYLGVSYARTDWKFARAVFEGCMVVGCPAGWNVADEVPSHGSGDARGVEGSEEGSKDDASRSERGTGNASASGVDDLRWRSIRGAIDQTATKPKLASQKDRNKRYLRARRDLDHANALWRQTAREYKHARYAVKKARHEVHKTRKAARVEFR